MTAPLFMGAAKGNHMADLIYHNGRVHGMTDDRQVTGAIAIRAGRILATGSFGALARFQRKDTRLVDLNGATVLPGFHDAHVHLAGYGMSLGRLELSDAGSVPEALELIRAAPPGDWLQGQGFSVTRWGAENLTAAALDAIWPDRPVALRSQDHHSAWFNSRALQLTGIGPDSEDPAGGRIQRDDFGRPTGLLFEAAASLALSRVPQPEAHTVCSALSAAAESLARLGITTVHDMAYEPATWWRATADSASSSDYPLRVWACLPQEELEAAAAIGLSTGQGGDNFVIGGAKFFIDGALGSATAWMLEPYEGTSDHGVAMLDSQVFHDRMALAASTGLAPVIHAIGDAAVHETLNALEASRDVWQPQGLRPRIEHAQHITRQDITRMAALGVIASMQPIHLTFDALQLHRLLGARAPQSFAFRQFREQGVALAFGSDTPVAPPGVIAGLRAAVERRGLNDSHFEPQEALSVDESLYAYTRGAAWAISREAVSGKLAAGFDADLVVLSGDPHDSLDGLNVVQTVKAGRVTYDAGVLEGAES